MTYAELQTAALFNTFSSARYLTYMQRFLNDGVLDICQQFNLFPSVEAAAFSGSSAVTLTQTFWKVNEVRLGRTYTGLNPNSIAADVTYQTLAPAGTVVSSGSPGVPTVDGYYYFKYLPADGSQFSVSLPSSGVVVVQGYTRPTLMSSDSHVSGLPNECDDALVAFARARAFRYEDDFQMAQFWKAEYEARLREIARTFEPTSGPDVIPGCWDDIGPGPFSQGLRRG